MTTMSHGTLLPRAARRSPILAALAALAFAPNALAQQASEGLASGVQTLPGTTSIAAVVGADLLTFDGVDLKRTSPGQPTTTLLSLPAYFFGSFLLPVNGTHVLLGYTGLTGGDAIWLVPLQGPAPTQALASLAFNYDAARFDGQRALVSARTGGFAAADNELWTLDLQTGATQRVASIPGASGPVAVAGNGDVYYATGFAGFPTPPGTCTFLRLPRPVVDAAIASNTVLGLVQTQIVAAGLDAAGDMAFDDDGDLLFVDWFNGRVSEISDAASAQPSVVPGVVSYATASVFPTSVQFVGGGQAGVFEPFQPTNGSLYVFETDYFATAGLRKVDAQPGALLVNAANPVPAGLLQFVASSGPANGLGILAFGIGPTGGTAPLAVPGFEAPLAWNTALTNAPVLLPFLFDANGGHVLNATNPGFATPFPATVQVAFVSSAGLLGATPAAALTISQ